VLVIVAISDGGGIVVVGISKVGVGLPARVATDVVASSDPGVFCTSVAVTSVGTAGRGRGLQAARIKTRTNAMGIMLLFFAQL
jgi:hypothetical protein